MKSKARVGSHPLHPILVSFPIAFFAGAFLADVLALIFHWIELHVTATYLSIGGVAFALAAAVPGLLDFVHTIPPDSSAKKRGARHGLLNISVVIAFSVAIWLRTQTETSASLVIALEGLGVGLLSVAGWLGGTLVYRNQIGVDIRYAEAGKWSEAYFTAGSGEIEVARTSELKAGQMKLLRFPNRRLVLARTADGYSAFDDRCTHRGGSLAGGALVCNIVQCPWHGSQFDTRTGGVKAGPAGEKITIHKVSERNGRIFVVLTPGTT